MTNDTKNIAEATADDKGAIKTSSIFNHQKSKLIVNHQASMAALEGYEITKIPTDEEFKELDRALALSFTKSPLIAPQAILRHKPWGRNLLLYARGDMLEDHIEDYLVNSELEQSIESDGEAQSIVTRIMSIIAYAAMDRCYEISGTTAHQPMTEAYYLHVSKQKRFDGDMAYMLYLDQCLVNLKLSDIYSIGPNLLSDMITKTPDPDVKDFSEIMRSGYFRLEGNDWRTVDGLPLDGFLILNNKSEKGFILTPMSSHMVSDDQQLVFTQSIKIEYPENNSDLKSKIIQSLDKNNLISQKLVDNYIEDAKNIVNEDSMSGVYIIADEQKQRIRRGQYILHNQARDWANAIVNMLIFIHENEGKEQSVYQSEAPEDLRKKANAGKAGARKAEQKIIAAGFVKVKRYEIGELLEKQNDKETDRANSSPGNDNPEKTIKDLKVASSVASDEKPKEEKPDPRKAKRLAAQAKKGKSDVLSSDGLNQIQSDNAENTAPQDNTDPDPLIEPAHSETSFLDEYPVNTAVELAPDMQEHVDHTLMASFKEMPPLGIRNWEKAVLSPLASMIMRRADVEAGAREDQEATKRRLMADIAPRLSGYNEYNQMLEAEHSSHPELRKVYRLTRPTVMRALDDDVIEAATHPIIIHVEEDESLADLIRFPGVTRQSQYDLPRTTLVRAWKHENKLHLDGYVHEGCLVGLRRLILDLETQDLSGHESDADETGIEDLWEAMYPALADVVLGPVDDADIWLYADQTHRKKSEGSLKSKPHKTTIRENNDSGSKQTNAEPWTAVDSSFQFWKNLTQSWENPPLSINSLKTLEAIVHGNKVAHTILNSVSGKLRYDSEIPSNTDQTETEVLKALAHHLSALAQSGVSDRSLLTLKTPNIRDNANLTNHNDVDGILVINDRAFFDNAPQNMLTHDEQKDKAIAVFYHIRLNGVAALVIQPNAAGQILYAQWARFDLEEQQDEDDLCWYLRGAISEALDGPETVQAAHENAPMRLMASQGADTFAKPIDKPMRTIAQVQIEPASMVIAIDIIRQWFDDQVKRHGPRLMEDRRQDGVWKIEHESNDRGNRHRWSVTLRMPEDKPGKIDIIVQTSMTTGVSPRLPSIVRQIAKATPTNGADGKLYGSPPYIKTKGEVLELVRHLQSKERVLPTLIMTQAPDGSYIMDTENVMDQAVGALNIYAITPAMTYTMSDMLGQSYRTFDGAARLFQPGFDPDYDNALRHPRIMPYGGSEGAIYAIISRATAATITRYDVADVNQIPAAEAADAITAETPTVSREIKAKPERNELIEQQSPSDLAKKTTKLAPKAKPENIIIDDEDIKQDADAEENPISDHESDLIQKGKTEASKPVADENEEPSTSEPKLAAEPTQNTAQLTAAVEDAVARQINKLGLPDMAQAIADIASKLENLRINNPVPYADHVALTQKDMEIEALRTELRTERDTMTALLDESDAQRQASEQTVLSLRQALNERRRASYHDGQTSYPDDLSGLHDWLESNLLPNVIIVPKAWRQMRRVRYTDMERLCQTLQLLDGAYTDMRAGEDGARERWEQGLMDLRLESKNQTKMGGGTKATDYQFQYDGQDYIMDRHIRGTESLYGQTDRLLRIYFHYDKNKQQVLIGHMPTHLTTPSS